MKSKPARVVPVRSQRVGIIRIGWNSLENKNKIFRKLLLNAAELFLGRRHCFLKKIRF
jgi:hypothetical protein